MNSKERILRELANLQQQLNDLEEEPNNKICENYEPEFIGKYEINERARRSWNLTLKEDGAWTKSYDFFEVTEWSNGEGWDIHIEGRSNHREFIQLHFTQLNALLKLLMEAGAITDDMLLNVRDDD
jgi:hypothetical protein